MMATYLFNEGKLTFFGAILCIAFGLAIAYLSIEYVPWAFGKIVGMSFGLVIAAVGGFAGRAQALGLKPFTNDPLGWRKAKQSYKAGEPTEAKGGKEPPRDES